MLPGGVERLWADIEQVVAKTLVCAAPPVAATYSGCFPGADPGAVCAAAAAEPGPLYWGDLALAGETVTREAKAEGKTVNAHLSHLIIHGVLHLLGYDHIEEEQAERMESLERRAMEQLGYSDPYGDSTDAI